MTSERALTFFDLPRDVRDAVYALVQLDEFIPSHTVDGNRLVVLAIDSDDPPTLRIAPRYEEMACIPEGTIPLQPLLQTSAQARLECLEFLFSTHVVLTVSGLRPLFDAVGPAVSSLRTLAVFSDNSDIANELAMDCGEFIVGILAAIESHVDTLGRLREVGLIFPRRDPGSGDSASGRGIGLAGVRHRLLESTMCSESRSDLGAPSPDRVDDAALLETLINPPFELSQFFKAGFANRFMTITPSSGYTSIKFKAVHTDGESPVRWKASRTEHECGSMICVALEEVKKFQKEYVDRLMRLEETDLQ